MLIRRMGECIAIEHAIRPVYFIDGYLGIIMFSVILFLSLMVFIYSGASLSYYFPFLPLFQDLKPSFVFEIYSPSVSHPSTSVSPRQGLHSSFPIPSKTILPSFSPPLLLYLSPPLLLSFSPPSLLISPSLSCFLFLPRYPPVFYLLNPSCPSFGVTLKPRISPYRTLINHCPISQGVSSPFGPSPL